jgi:protein N-lysine methyltransferase METTL21A
MRQNVSLNALQESIVVHELDWWVAYTSFDVLTSDICRRGKELPPLAGINMILAADCVYFEPAFPLLVKTLVGLAKVAGPDCEILFCYKQRRKVRLYRLMEDTFTFYPGRQALLFPPQEKLYMV